ncbi:MAG TPA: OsmC family protein [Gemmatimonadaceae bacterium]|nr:OsmC family protein [Gemmatimonadaceae bacterium]
MKIILTSEYSIRLEPDAGPMTIEAMEPDEQYSPFHMLASSLAYCTFSVMYSWATHSKQSVDDLAIEVQWKFSDDEPHRVSEISMQYEWPSLPEKKRNAARRVAEMCTVHATLMHPPTIDIGELGSTQGDTTNASDEAEAHAHTPAAGSAT